jgi:hypothetical protein
LALNKQSKTRDEKHGRTTIATKTRQDGENNKPKKKQLGGARQIHRFWGRESIRLIRLPSELIWRQLM